MTVEEMQEAKFRQKLTYEDISRRSGVPVGTVQKILGGFTKSPRISTMQALEKALLPGAIESKEEESLPDYAAQYELREHERRNPPVVSEARPVYGAGYSAGRMRADGKKDASYHVYARQGQYTIADRNTLPGDRRTELIDGFLYDMAAPKLIHQALQNSLAMAISNYIAGHDGDCMCFESDTDVVLGEDNRTVVMPDILVVCDREKLHEDAVYGAPDLVIEILSPSTQKKDMTVKYHKYAEAGVREYWIVDPESRRVLVYRIDLINGEKEGEGDPAVHEGDRDGKKYPKGEKVAIYGFDSVIPVGIYGGDCRIDLKAIYEKLKFMYAR